MKIWTYGSSPRSGSRNAWTRMKYMNCSIRLSNFRNFFCAIQMISCLDWWPQTKPGYITMTRRQSSNQWSGGIAAYPAPQKIPSAKIRWENCRLDFLGSTRHPPHWLSPESQTINVEHYSSVISAGAVEGHFEGKTPRRGHQGDLVLLRSCPGSPGTCNPEETGLPGRPLSWSLTLFSESGPVVLPPVPWTQKNNRKVSIFRPTRRSLLPRRPGWTDILLNLFFWVACKS